MSSIFSSATSCQLVLALLLSEMGQYYLGNPAKSCLLALLVFEGERLLPAKLSFSGATASVDVADGWLVLVLSVCLLLEGCLARRNLRGLAMIYGTVSEIIEIAFDISLEGDDGRGTYLSLLLAALFAFVLLLVPTTDFFLV